jgi:hypothetical protein
MSESEALIRELVALLADVIEGSVHKTEACDLLEHVNDWLIRQGRRGKPFTVIQGGKSMNPAIDLSDR